MVGGWTSITLPLLLLALWLSAPVLPWPLPSKTAHAEEEWTGQRIMKEAFKRHHLSPYVYEEQTMILMDSAGHRDVRDVRRFSRVESDGTVKFLLVFDNPAEVRGVALLAIRYPSGKTESGVYLPAFGKKLNFQGGETRGSNFLGTDFAIEDLTAEVLSDFRYVRVADKEINKVAYFVVEAFPLDMTIERTTGYSLRRHFIRKDNFFIVRTDYYDRRKRLFKRQTCHDLKRVEGDMWRANMILMENFKEKHKTLIKITKRVFSPDYVPPEIFTPAWLMEDRHIRDPKKGPIDQASPIPGQPDKTPHIPQDQAPR